MIHIHLIQSSEKIQEITTKTVNIFKALAPSKAKWIQPQYDVIQTKRWVCFEGTPPSGGDFYRAYILKEPDHYFQVIGIWKPNEQANARNDIRLVAQNITRASP